MKKIISLAIVFMLFIAPVFAIIETKQPIDNINIEWWQKLDDEYLENYIAQALKSNHDIKTASLLVEQAKINVTATRAGQLPTVIIGAAPSTVKMPGATTANNSFAVPILAQYELDIFGKNWDKTKSAKKLLQSAQYEEEAADISIISLVGSLYYNIVRLDKTIELQKKLTEDRKIIHNMMRLSNNEGIVSTSDLILSEKAFVLAQNNLIEYEKLRHSALCALAVLIGDSPENIDSYKRISYDKLKDSFDIPKEIDSEIIVNRPDYKSLEHQLEAAGLNVRVAKKEFLPSINILGLVSFLATSAAPTMNWQNALAGLGGAVELPIFTGFARIANLKLHKNKYKQLVEQYQKTNLTAIQEVNDALYNYRSDETKYENNKKAYEIQKEDYGFAKSKYNEGVISKLDLLQQEETLIFTNQSTVASKIDCYIDKIGLYKATGARI